MALFLFSIFFIVNVQLALVVIRKIVDSVPKMSFCYSIGVHVIGNHADFNSLEINTILLQQGTIGK
jgi:hypothetical protein